jgi:hypothetical protein
MDAHNNNDKIADDYANRDHFMDKCEFHHIAVFNYHDAI